MYQFFKINKKANLKQIVGLFIVVMFKKWHWTEQNAFSEKID